MQDIIAAKADAAAVVSQPGEAPAFAASAMNKVRLSNHFADLAKVLAIDGLQQGKAALCGVHKNAPEVKAAMRQLQDKAFYRMVGSEGTIQLRKQIEARFRRRDKTISERMLGCMFQTHKRILGDLLSNKMLLQEVGMTIRQREGVETLKATAAKASHDILSCPEQPSGKRSEAYKTPGAPLAMTLSLKYGFVHFGAPETSEFGVLGPRRSASWSPRRNAVDEASSNMTTVVIDLRSTAMPCGRGN
eukprot:TRINITY_DN27689_c0_g1_i1.p1 TRINITY_DN27689_c0_g1~~TRINITY_DN27689_c0_g1_i1.p1  ORF type:complete len:246 (+),score=49.33 TRINITY_DN27689_c0_g1_i1:337-1074(+)